MTRLRVFPIEIETGRWYGVPREQRRCTIGCDHIGDTAHFLHGCEHITTERISSLNRYESTLDATKKPLRYWRDIARRLECRWRERTRKLRRATAAPLDPADACDSEPAAELDAALAENVTAEDIRFYGTATVNPQQPAAKAQSKRRQQGRRKKAPNASLDDLRHDDKRNRELLAIRIPPWHCL